MEGNEVVPGGQCRASVRGAVLGSLRSWQAESAAQGGWPSTAVILPQGGGGGFHPRGGWGMDPKGGLSEHQRVSSALLQTKTNPKTSKNKTQKHSSEMLLIGQPWGSCILG